MKIKQSISLYFFSINFRLKIYKELVRLCFLFFDRQKWLYERRKNRDSKRGLENILKKFK
jgi:hypothetical protein